MIHSVQGGGKGHGKGLYVTVVGDAKQLGGRLGLAGGHVEEFVIVLSMAKKEKERKKSISRTSRLKLEWRWGWHHVSIQLSRSHLPHPPYHIYISQGKEMKRQQNASSHCVGWGGVGLG